MVPRKLVPVGAGFYFLMKQASKSVLEKKIKKGWLFIQRV
ncbi:hypothetical protein ANHS_1883 [Ligilactobacillus ruminis ATCC 25644]|nr:hypothetical protein ANHS_1883 [Ligilactobacillus ruminis ATCC 25644]